MAAKTPAAKIYIDTVKIEQLDYASLKIDTSKLDVAFCYNRQIRGLDSLRRETAFGI